MAPAPATVGVVGLGNMGLPMSGHLLAAGFQVSGHDIRPAAVTTFTDAGGLAASAPAEVAASADVVVTSLPSVAALHDVVAGPAGLVSAARAGSVVIETSTLPIAAKEEARQVLAEAGVAVLDCPLSGTASQMRERDIAVYASGDQTTIEQCGDVFSAFSRVRYDVGVFGNGMRMKLIANLLVTVHHTVAAEALVLARRAGLDPALALRALSDGAGNSRMLEVRGPMMLAGSFSNANMRLQYFLKDIDLIDALGREVRCPLPLFTASAQLHLAALAQGREDEDPACVYAVLQGMLAP